MILARLFIYHDNFYESMPFVFCSKCKALLLRSEIVFCPMCGHRLKQLDGDVQLIEVSDEEIRGKRIEDKINLVRAKVKWE